MAEQYAFLVALVEHESKQLDPMGVREEMMVADPVESNVRAVPEDGTYIRLGVRFESQMAYNNLRRVDSFTQQEPHLLGPEPVGGVGDDRRASPDVRPRRRTKDVRLAFGHTSLAGRNFEGSCAVPGAAHAFGQLAHEHVRQRIGIQCPYHRV